MNLVSVILPFYNAEDLLVKTIQSIIGQTYSHIELIMIDDGSTDQSQQVARSYTHLSNVKLLIQENEGAAVARNTGLKAASGIFIQFMDAGDIITADKIQQQVEAIRDDMHKVAVCNYVMFSNEADLQSDHFPDQSSFIYTTNETQDFLINLWGGYGRRNFIQTNSWLIPRNLIERAGGWRPYRCPDDDGEFFSRILLASSGIVYTPGVYNYYHTVSAAGVQLSKSKDRKHLMNSLLSIDLKHKYLLAKGKHPKIKAAIGSQYFRFAVDTYPHQRILSKIAFKRYKSLGHKIEAPLIGGWPFELIKYVFGWRIARLIRYILRD